MKSLRNKSIAFKLLAGTLGALSGYVIIIGILAYLSARDSIGDSYDQSLVVNANALLFIMQEEAARGGLDKPLSINISDENLSEEDKSFFKSMSEYRMLRIWYKGKLILTSADDMATAKPYPPGFSDQVEDGDMWRIYSLQVPNRSLIIELGEQQNARTYLVLNIAKDLVLPFAFSLPIVALMFWRAIRTGIADLLKVTSQVEARSPDQMTPLDTTDLPPDLLPLVQAINALLQRLNESLSRERQITELAAHELRTPLTAVRLQAQLAQRAPSDAARTAALSGLLTGIDRAGHLVEQMLTLTRVEQSEFELTGIDGVDTIRRVIEELRPLAERRGQTIRCDCPSDLPLQANDDLLFVTLVNVVGNSVKYAPENTEIRIAVATQDGKGRIEVIDQGGGIPEAVRGRIFERFFRFNAGKVLGSGLGLTIAKQCAERMNATLTLHTPRSGKGLCVRIECASAPQVR
jgi:signal transduction histidine kinase